MYFGSLLKYLLNILTEIHTLPETIADDFGRSVRIKWSTEVNSYLDLQETNTRISVRIQPVSCALTHSSHMRLTQFSLHAL